jgi:hypothetical protein
MGRITKLFGLALSTLLVAVVLAAVVMRFVIGPEKIKSWVLPRAETALGRKVEIADAGLSFWPPLGIVLEGLAVSNSAGFPEPFLLQAGRARAQIGIWPLLGGRIVFDDLELADVYCSYIVNPDGQSNVSDLLGGEGELPPILFERFSLDRLVVRYRDLRSGTGGDLDSLSVHARLQPADRTVSVKVDLPHWRWYDSADTIESRDPVQLSISGDMGADLKSLTVTKLEGSLSGLPVGGAGSLRARPAGLEAGFDLKLGPIDLADLVKRLPPARRSALEAFTLSGTLSGEFKLGYDGAMSNPVELEGEMVWLSGTIDYDDRQVARFQSLSLPVGSRGFHVSADDLMIFDGPTQVAVVGTPWPPERFEVTVSGTADLGAISQATGQGPYGGRLAYAFSGTGGGLDLSRWAVRLRVNPERATVLQSGKSELRVDGGSVVYDGEEIEWRDVEVESGPTRATLAGRAGSLPWSSFFDSSAWALTMDLDVQSSFADIDRFFPELAPDTAQPREESAVPALPSLAASVKLRADTLVVGGARWLNVAGELSYRDGRMTIDTLYGLVYGGQAALAGSVDLRRPDAPAYDLSATADSVEVGDVLSRFVRAGRYLRGKSSLSARVTGTGTELSDLVEELTVAGSASLLDTRLVNVEAARSVMGLIGAPQRDTLPLRALRNSFSVAHGKVRLDDFACTALGSDWKIAGLAGFDGSLDYSIATRLSASLSERFQLPEALASRFSGEALAGADPVSLLKDEEGRVGLYLRLAGSYDKPSVTFDWERLEPEIRARFKARVLDKLQKDAAEKAKTGLGNLLEKLKP